MKCFCVYAIAVALLWLPRESSLHSWARFFFNASVNTFKSANKNFDNTLNALHPIALLAEKENNESYTFGKMLKKKNEVDIIHTIIKKTDDHEKCNHWEFVQHWEKIPGVGPTLAIWAFRRERFLGVCINKHKLRLCAHGGMQTYGDNYWETYSPTVNWISVRFLIIVAQIIKLDIKAIYFVLASSQAELDVPVYM